MYIIFFFIPFTRPGHFLIYLPPFHIPSVSGLPFCVKLTKARVILGEGISIEKMPAPELPRGLAWGVFSWLLMDVGGAAQCGTLGWRLGAIRKQADETFRNKSGSRAPPWLLPPPGSGPESLPPLPLRTDCCGRLGK